MKHRTRYMLAVVVLVTLSLVLVGLTGYLLGGWIRALETVVVVAGIGIFSTAFYWAIAVLSMGPREP